VSEGWAELHEAIAAIRDGIEQAVAEGAGSDVKFEVGPIELELTATVHKDASGEVKVSLLPWSASAKGGLSAEHTQRIKFTLQPLEPVDSKAPEAKAERRKLKVSGSDGDEAED
jgi:Trypsin-co-occurring domain 2